MKKLGFKRLTDTAILPVRAHATDSGFDLFADEDVVINPNGTAVIHTGIAVVLPPNHEAQVRPRSGVTSKTKLRVQLGTIDNDYTGEIGIIVDNIETNDVMGCGYYRSIDERGSNRLGGEGIYEGAYAIHKGDKIAQLVVQELPQLEPYEVDELPNTERGGKGFGSSGV